MTGATASARPLAGLRVLDLGGPAVEITGRILAELGADVVLAEPPGGGAARSAPRTGGVAVDHAVRNAGKRGVVLDGPDGPGLADLVAAADIVLHPWTPAELARRGLDVDDVVARRPGLVLMGITDFGASGPLAGWAGSPDVHAAVGGLLARSGLPGREPLLPPEHLALEAAATQAAWFALLAHRAARRAGRGDVVDFSVLEGVAHSLDPGFGISGSARGGMSSSEKHRGRPDVRHLYPIFPCADGWVRICLLSPRQWQGMWRWMGEPEEFADPRFGKLKDRFDARDRIYPLIEKLCATRTRDQVAAEAEAHGVPAAGVLSLGEVTEHEHFSERGAVAEAEVAPGVHATVPTGMLTDEAGRLGRRGRAPELGEHTAQVAREWTPRDATVATVASEGQWSTPIGGQGGTGDPGSAGQPLRGLRVVDLGVIVAGAEVSRLLADHGAEVVKVESSTYPDGSRQSVDGRSMTPSFAWGNRNKASIGVDLRDPRGKELFRSLVAGSDVVLSNFKPGTMESLGFDDATLRAVNERVITVESSAFGTTGPWARRMGYGPLVRAGTALSGLWLYPDEDDSFSDAITIYPDHVAGRVAALAVLAKLTERERTGRGGSVSVAQSEIILSQMAGPLLREQLRPGTVVPEGNDRTGDAPRGVVACAGDDEWCVVDVGGDASFAGLARAIGRPEWVEDPRYATAAGRVGHREELRAALGAWTADHHPRTVASTLQEHGVAAGYMQRVAEFPDDPHLTERGFLVRQDQPGFDDPLPAHGAEALSRVVPPLLLGPAPHQAEHTREVVERVLGLEAEQVEELLAEGVLEEYDPP